MTLSRRLISQSLIHVAAPLLVGGSVYLLWRADTLLMFSWFETLGLSETVRSARELAAPLRCRVPSWFLFSLPDAAWAYSAAMFPAMVWHDVSARTRFSLMFVGPVCAFGGELGQLVGFVPGTFDIIDLALVGASYIGALTAVQTWRGKHDA